MTLQDLGRLVWAVDQATAPFYETRENMSGLLNSGLIEIAYPDPYMPDWAYFKVTANGVLVAWRALDAANTWED